MKKSKIILIAILSVFAVAIFGVAAYLIAPFPVDDVAQSILDQSNNVTVNGNITTVLGDETINTAIIFYPGAKVESIAYLPLFEKIVASTGVTCFLVEMPFNLAIFDTNAANDIINMHKEIENWYICGHSLGGAMASSYASDNPHIIDGVIVLGAYVYGDFPKENTLTIYGTFNDNIANGIDYTDNIVIVEGGNHAKFGNYGPQPGDPDGTISSEEQQTVTSDAIKRFLDAQGVL